MANTTEAGKTSRDGSMGVIHSEDGSIREVRVQLHEGPCVLWHHVDGRWQPDEDLSTWGAHRTFGRLLNQSGVESVPDAEAQVLILRDAFVRCERPEEAQAEAA